MRTLLLVFALLLITSATHARRNLPPTEAVGYPSPYDLITGRFPRTPGAIPAKVPTPTTDWEKLAFRIRFGSDATNPAVYFALAQLHDQRHEADLTYYAYQRALELGLTSTDADAARARLTALTAAWRAAARKDPPTDSHFTFARRGADRWSHAFDRNAAQALRDREDLTSVAVLTRLAQEADIEVPPVILGADSFMRRWGVALLVAAVAVVIWPIFIIAISRRRRPTPSTS